MAGALSAGIRQDKRSARNLIKRVQSLNFSMASPTAWVPNCKPLDTAGGALVWEQVYAEEPRFYLSTKGDLPSLFPSRESRNSSEPGRFWILPAAPKCDRLSCLRSMNGYTTCT